MPSDPTLPRYGTDLIAKKIDIATKIDFCKSSFSVSGDQPQIMQISFDKAESFLSISVKSA
jgi:hypothetical protein